jgi:hypothetical protein
MAVEGKVVRVLDPLLVVVNIGSEQGVEEGDPFVVFALGEELTDPETHEQLGRLEIVRGRAVAKHVQPRLTTLRSTERARQRIDRERPLPPDPMRRVFGSIVDQMGPRVEVVTEEVEVDAPFHGAVVGDYARRKR